MGARKWISPMLQGRGLRTINALPPLPAQTRPAWQRGADAAAATRKQRKSIHGPQWHVPGFALLSILDPRRR